jgi:hypothetical protein
MKSLNLGGATKYLKYGERVRPARDWYILLVIFSVMLGVSVAWNLWLFGQVTQGEVIGNTVTAPSAEIQLTEVKTLFDQRATERSRYTSQYRFVDPSS